MVEAIIEGGQAREELMKARGQQQQQQQQQRTPDAKQAAAKPAQAGGQEQQEQQEESKGDRIAAVVQQVMQLKGAACPERDVPGPGEGPVARPSVDLWAPRFR